MSLSPTRRRSRARGGGRRRRAAGRWPDRCRRRRCRWRCRAARRTSSVCPRAFSSSMTAAGQRRLDFEHARLRAVVVERADRMQRVDARRLDRRLHVHAEVDDVQQHEQDLLVLAVAARRADREERLAVLQHDGRRQRGPRPLAAGEDVRARRIEMERLHPVAHRHAGAPGDERAAEQPAGARRRGEEIARRRRRPGSTSCRRVPCSGLRLKAEARLRREASASGCSREIRSAAPFRAPDRPGRCSRLARFGSIRRAAERRVRLRQQHVAGHADEIGIAVVAIAIGVRQLDRLDDRVQRVGRAARPSPRGRSPRGSAASAAATVPGSRTPPCRRCSRDTAPTPAPRSCRGSRRDPLRSSRRRPRGRPRSSRARSVLCRTRRGRPRSPARATRRAPAPSFSAAASARSVAARFGCRNISPTGVICRRR